MANSAKRSRPHGRLHRATSALLVATVALVTFAFVPPAVVDGEGDDVDGPICRKCESTGRTECKEHDKDLCELEDHVLYCSEVADCTTCGGTGFVDDPTGGLDFTTAHLGQADIGGTFDIDLAVAIRPTTTLHEGQVGVHSAGFYEGEGEGFSWLVRGGVVQLPDLWFYGVQGGMRPTFRAEAGIAAGDGGSAAGAIRYLVMMNDPEQLLLFPYAYNAVTMGVTASGTF